VGRIFSSLDDEDFNRLFLDFRYMAYRLETLQRYDVSYEKNEFGRFAYRPAIVAQSGHCGGAQ
jgi:hypothetical protein